MDTAHLKSKSHLNDDPVQGSGGGSHAGMKKDGYLGVGWRNKKNKKEG